MTERINDVIILGVAVGEQISDGRITQCTAGYSSTVGFVRLYPTRIDSPLSVWSVVSVEVERNPKDNRRESWKFPESRKGWDELNQHITVLGTYPKIGRLGLLDSIKSKCVMDINDKRDSLGIIQPVIKRSYLAPNQKHYQTYQPLFDVMEHADVKTKRDYMAEPRFTFLCGTGCRAKSGHDMQLLDEGCYIGMNRNQGNEQQIFQNMGIGQSDWTHYFLVGNQANQRTSFMVINVLRQKQTIFQNQLFPEGVMPDAEKKSH